MKWTAPAALLATTLLAGTGKAQDFTYNSSFQFNRSVGGAAGGPFGAGLTGLSNSRFGGFGILGHSTSGYRLNGTFNNYAIYGNGLFGPFGSGSTFGSSGFGGFFANLMPQIHQHGPLYNYGPYYGYPPFEPYGPWDAYLRYHQPMALVEDRGGHPWLGRGNPNPLCGSLCKRRAANSDGCAAASQVTGGGLVAARTGHGWGDASGGCCRRGKASASDSCGAVAAADAHGVPVLSRYAGCGSHAASSAYYQGAAVPTVNPCQ